MAREKALYRDNMEIINEHFGECNPKSGFKEAPALLPIRKVASFVGIDYRTLTKEKNLEKIQVGCHLMIPKTGLARWMS
jgi:hypothetical protein